MRIGIDGYNLALPQGTGIASYGRTLAGALRGGGHRIEGVFGIDAGAEPHMREVLFFDRLGREVHSTRRQQRREARRITRAALPFVPTRAAVVPLTDRVEHDAFADRLPVFDRLLTSPLLFEVAHRRFRTYRRFVRLRLPDPPEIMHWTYPVPIELVGARNIYTMHDIVPLKLPHTTLDGKEMYRSLLARCIERAAQVCTVSEASRSDIIAEFGVAADRITNTYQAAPPFPGFQARDPASDAAAVGRVLGLEPQGYFLFFGAVEPKKNVGRLIEAFLSLEGDTPLVLVGGKGWQSESELRLLDQGPERTAALSRRVRRLEHLPRGLLLQLIRSARAVVFPSIYEGFGLPVLEAMQLGTPVLTSRTSSLPEVAGDAALLVDPYDVRAIAAGMRALDTDDALRARLARAGPVQAERFAGSRYLERLEDMYARAGRHC